jgi:hypothetical protein
LGVIAQAGQNVLRQIPYRDNERCARIYEDKMLNPMNDMKSKGVKKGETNIQESASERSFEVMKYWMGLKEAREDYEIYVH